ncbi:hypothetical protein [Lentisalinibacter sediminis]|uniref:hypothetical protein n=1 Tax=Lentisalinibacter sediminis TaxID=2992237 RepID=UPI003864A349
MTDYRLHPSARLRALFEATEIPYQGQDPNLARVVFVGLDANYSPEISDDPTFFSRILEYHEDGVAFWRKYGVHHPFLLEEYPLPRNTGGVPYHRKFSWMGLTSDYAPYVSFVELLPVPTTGSTESRTFWQLFSVDHARRLDALFADGFKRRVYLSKSLVDNYMRKANRRWGVFSWLPETFALGLLGSFANTDFFGAPHFSATQYKKTVFEELGADVREFCDQYRLAGA